MSTHVTKTFKSLDQQIDLLKERKLIIRDEEKAKRHLLEKNYFDLINGFETLLLTDSKATNKESFFLKTFYCCMILIKN